jgi:hypothetical protein
MTKTKPALRTERGGTEITRFNPFKHGILSRYTVLPWEDTAEYNARLPGWPEWPRSIDEAKRQFQARAEQSRYEAALAAKAATALQAE